MAIFDKSLSFLPVPKFVLGCLYFFYLSVSVFTINKVQPDSTDYSNPTKFIIKAVINFLDRSKKKVPCFCYLNTRESLNLMYLNLLTYSSLQLENRYNETCQQGESTSKTKLYT